MRIENKDEFNIIGIKTWVSDTDNNEFGKFWKKCHQEGNIEEIKRFKDIQYF